MSHGDAMMFGGSPVPADRSVDQRFFVPFRVRRKEPDLVNRSNDWQLQRGSQLSPLRWVTLSDSEGFGIDTDGLLWTWPTSSRPVTADLVSVSLKRAVRSRLASASGTNELTMDPLDPSNTEFVLMEEGEEDEDLTLATQELLMPPSPMQAPSVNELQQVGISNLGVSFKAGITWAVDDSDGHLWQLKRAPKSKDGNWAAERFEYLAQVSCFACGPEHQAAVTTYTVPCYDIRQTGLKAQEECGGNSQSGDETNARNSKETVKGRVPSLQQICEDKLCAKLNPRSFGLVCDIAWELNRPALLDRAFQFLCANAPLMFSKLHLPTLSQLPIEVLAALEIAAKSKGLADSGVSASAPSRKESREEVCQNDATNDLPFRQGLGCLWCWSVQMAKRATKSLGVAEHAQTGAQHCVQALWRWLCIRFGSSISDGFGWWEDVEWNQQALWKWPVVPSGLPSFVALGNFGAGDCGGRGPHCREVGLVICPLRVGTGRS